MVCYDICLYIYIYIFIYLINISRISIHKLKYRNIAHNCINRPDSKDDVHLWWVSDQLSGMITKESNLEVGNHHIYTSYIYILYIL